MILDDVVALHRLVKDLIKCVEFYLDRVNELEEENKRLKEQIRRMKTC
jgi:cell shape-determining protein MreC